MGKCLSVITIVRDDLPANLPAIRLGSTLHVRHDLPDELVEHFANLLAA